MIVSRAAVSLPERAATAPRTHRGRAFLYCGQGSQTYQMGRKIYDADPGFRSCLQDLDARMARRLGGSVLDRLYDPNRRMSEPFDDLTYSHPAIFMIELALSRTLEAVTGPPDCLVGSSLGELTAAVVSEALALDDAMDILALNVRALTRSGIGGGMLAVVAPSSLWERSPDLMDGCEFAADFGESHFVVAGPDERLEAAQAALAQHHISCLRLPVNHAFHSRVIDDLRPLFTADALGVRFRPPAIPVISCVTCAPIERYSLDHLWRAIREPLLMNAAIAALGRLGAFDAVDLGPGSTFVPLFDPATRAASGSAPHRVLTPLGDELRNLRRAQDVLATDVSLTGSLRW